MRTLLTIALLCSSLLLQPAGAQQLDSLTLKANAPTPPAFVGASYSGQPGPATYYYWVAAVYPGGESGVAGPATVRGVANTLGGGNTINISWSASFGASSYRVIRTQTPVFPGNCSSCLLATGVTGTTTTDTGASLSAYTGGSSAAPATAGFSVNVRDYASPRLELKLNGAVVATFDSSGIASGGGSSSVGALDDLTDVANSSPTTGDLLIYDGADYANGKFTTYQGFTYPDGAAVAYVPIRYPVAATVQSVYCETDAGTVTLNVYESTDSDSGTSSTIAGPITCDAGGESGSISDSSIAGGSYARFVFSSVSGMTVTHVQIGAK